jgi:predicted flap endonuclease-1-like 5' DNA nuclease
LQNQIRPIRPSEAAGTSWIVAGLLALFGFVVLSNTGWTFLQAIFAAGVVFVVIGILISQTVGRIKPLSAHSGPTPTMPVETEKGVALGVDMSALRPRDLSRPSPHRDTPTPSILSDGKFKNAVEPDLEQPIRGTVEAAHATRVPSPAPINAADPGVARPVGATANPTPLEQPAPLHGRVISPEAPEPIDPTREGPKVSRNEAAMAAGAPLVVTPSGTPAAQSYNEPGDGSDTVVATDAAIAPAAGTDSGRGSDAIDHGKPGPSSAEERVAQGDDRAHSGSSRAPAFGGVGDRDDGADVGTKPPALDGPREGGADDLLRIRGIGPKMAEMLHGMGYYHFDQIGSWGDEEIAWVDNNLEGFKGRVSRDEWVPQARALSEGRDPE